MQIGKNIKTLRQRKNLTQEQVADALGISYQAVSKWETDANTPDIALLPDIAALFNVSIDALFSDNIADYADAFSFAKDDDVIRIVQLQGTKLLRVTPRISPDDPPIELAFPRNCGDKPLKIEVYGHLFATSIAGDVVCHQNLECGGIAGDVRCEGNIRANEINSFGPIVCQNITDCYKLQAKNVECAGEIHAVYLNCEQIR